MGPVEQVKILLVDDREENLITLAAVLAAPEYELITARSGQEALRRLLDQDFAVILMDVQMPGMDGFETASIIKQRERSKGIPIIFVTAISKDEPFVYRGYGVGAVDYLSKPFDPQILRSKVAVFAELFRRAELIRRQGESLRQKERAERERELARLELESLRREQVIYQKYRDLVDGINHGIVWSADPVTFAFSFVSGVAREIAGYPTEEWFSDAEFWRRSLPPEDLPLVMNHLQAVRETGQPRAFEHRFIHADGELLWFHTGVRLSKRVEDGQAELHGLSVDITHLKRTESELRASETRFRYLSEAIPQIVWTADSQGICDYRNPKFYEYTGLLDAGDEAGGDASENADLKDADRNFLAEAHPDDRPLAQRTFDQARASDAAFECECRLRGGDGMFRWFLMRATPFKDSLHQLTRWFGTATDIDEQKHVEANLRFLAEASAVLSASLDYQATLARVAELAAPALCDGCFIDLLQEDGHSSTLIFGQAGRQLLNGQVEECAPLNWQPGFGPNQVIQTGVAELYPDPSDELGFHSAMVVPLQVRGRALGAITFVSAASDRRYNRQDLGFAEELARRAAAAVDNARLYEEAQKAIHARDEFLSIASHELKTPLTPLKLQLQTLRRLQDRGMVEGQDFHDRLRKVLNTSDRQIERLNKLVEELLDVSRINNGKLLLSPEEVDLTELVSEITQRFNNELQVSQCSLRIDARAKIVGHWDRLRIEQVVVNLLTNAMKYGPEKPILIEVRSEADGAMALIRIQDHGIGISKADQDRIFGRFERAVPAANFGGLGLGLYIVSQILEAHGGSVTVESELGSGSTFTVRLPTRTMTTSTGIPSSHSASQVIGQINVNGTGSSQQLETSV